MIEPDRILEGLVRTLEQSVLPALGPGFARGQLHAVLEVLASLQGQFVWGGMLMEGESAALAELAARTAQVVDGPLAERLRAYANGSDAATPDRIREGRALVCALIDTGLADEGPVAVMVDSWLANDSLLKAIALRPSRLAEISHG